MKRRITAPREVLAELREDFSLCGKCKLCQAVMAQQCEDPRFWRNCPSGTRFRYEGYYAGGKLEMARCMDLAEIEPDDTMRHALYTCMLCGSCQDRCYPVKQLHPMWVFELMREQAVQDGWWPSDWFAGTYENLENTDNVYGVTADKRISWAKGLKLKDALKEKVEYILFVGDEYSAFDSLAPRMQAVANVLTAGGVDFGILGKDEVSSGALLLQLGDRDYFETFAVANIELFEKAGVKEIITADPHVATVLGEEYTKLADIESYHVSKIFNTLFHKEALKASRDVKIKAVYHDPCRLGRRLGVFEEPRDVLGRVPGLELVEFERARKNSLCCGGGGGAYLWESDYARWVTNERLFEAEHVGAGAIVTACPLCVRLFEDAIKAKKSKLKVYDLAEVIEQAL